MDFLRFCASLDGEIYVILDAETKLGKAFVFDVMIGFREYDREQSWPIVELQLYLERITFSAL